MINTIANFINRLDSLVWGWWMILLLLGTHIFMTIRTGVIQRKIGKSNIIFHSCLNWALGNPGIIHRIIAGAGKTVWTDPP